MSAVRPGTIADVMREYGGIQSPASSLDEVVRRVERVQAVRFAFHVWKEHPNFGADTFRFNIPYPEIPRLVPISLPVLPAAEIVSTGKAVLMGAVLSGSMISMPDVSDLGGGTVGEMQTAQPVPGSRSAANVRQREQPPHESIYALKTAYGKYGMVELVSLAAGDKEEAVRSFAVFAAVMGAARNDEEIKIGRRPRDLVLEDYPLWLQTGAPDALKHAVDNGADVPVALYNEDGMFTGQETRRFQLGEDDAKRGERLIIEIMGSVGQAHQAALDPSNGVLPLTRDALNTFRNGGQGGKNRLDELDMWLQKQFPSFPMDTDVERSALALQDTVKQGAAGTEAIAGALLAVAQQNQMILEEMAAQRKQTDEVLAAALGRKRKPGE